MFWVSIGKEKRLECRKNSGIHVKSIGSDGGRAFHPRTYPFIYARLILSIRGDAVLYTITSDTVFRIYSPVLDDPTWFQLVSSIDHRAFAKPTIPLTGKGKDKDTAGRQGWLWTLDAEVFRAGLLDEISGANEGKAKPSAMTRKILEVLASEESDVLMYLNNQGNLALRSIVVRQLYQDLEMLMGRTLTENRLL